jgi:hypothetical protein
MEYVNVRPDALHTVVLLQLVLIALALIGAWLAIRARIREHVRHHC